jgi:GT2 family glycosyltransferase
MSWEIVHLDLKQAPSVLDAGASPVYVVYWWGDLPLGARAYAPEELPLRRDRLLALAARFLAEQVASRATGFRGPPLARYDGQALMQPPLTEVRNVRVDMALLSELERPVHPDADDLAVIVCTRDRPGPLRTCLNALSAQKAPPGEILVVDNSSERTAASVCLDFPRVRYLHEASPGLSRARNCGLAASTRPLVAFTDDDVEVHERWSGEIVRAFEESDVESVTGLVIPARLDTEAQRVFQMDMGGFGASCLPTRFGQVFFEETRHRGTQVWHVGAGANMAFRRALFERIGGFDERLGAGAAGCSEDSEIWYRILATGGECFYEPRALVFHHHRDDWPGLRRQMRAYIRGHVAALVVQHDRYRHGGNIHRILVQLPRYFMRTALDIVRNGKPHRGRVLLEEIRGWLGGVLFLFNPIWRSRRAVPTLAPPPDQES